MEPPIETSVKLIGPGPQRWAFGHNMLCERVREPVPDGPVPFAIKTWKTQGETYCVRKGDWTAEWETSPNIPPLVDSGGPRAIFPLGENLVVKVASMFPNQESEADVMRFIQRLEPDIPMAQLYFDYYDEEWERVYYIMERVHGRTLAQAWMDISLEQTGRLVEEIVRYMLKLAKHTSPYLRSTTGFGVHDGLLMGPIKEYDRLPCWSPRNAHPKLDAKQFKSFLRSADFFNWRTFDMEWQQDDEPFYLTHVSSCVKFSCCPRCVWAYPQRFRQTSILRTSS